MISFCEISYNNATLNWKQEICSSSITMHLSNKSILFLFQDDSKSIFIFYIVLIGFK